ncbi:MAG: EamA family transporter [Anaerolineae bacterium]|nr:EamA family transporter [Anaerolineae bacterium]
MRGTILIALAAVLWGTTGTSQALAPQGATPLAIGAMRLLVGGGALMLLSVSRGEITAYKGWLQPRTLLAGVSAALYQLTFFAGVALTGVAVGTIIAIGSAPIFTGILGYFGRGEALRQRWFVATGMAIMGCVLLAFSGNDTVEINPLGILLSLSAGLSYAAFALGNKKLIENHQPDAAMAVSFSIGALILLPTLFFVDVSWATTPGGMVIILHLGLIATGLAYMLFGRGLQTIPVSTAGTLALAEPLTATLLGIFVLGEQLTPLALFGILILFVGLLLCMDASVKPKPQSAS